ncbi:hypothetical protein ACFQJ7_13630 [Halovenus rubra]|uniref:Uncharacterized protein n=2 Tax=Halovenus rubra TaxID=869890 RepID=A0ACC7DZJ9_9EURY
MPPRLSRFTDRLETLANGAVSGDPSPGVKKGDGGYADWVIVVIHGLREYLDLPYRRLLDLLQEMHRVIEKLNLEPSELPDFTTVCARKHGQRLLTTGPVRIFSAFPSDSGGLESVEYSIYSVHCHHCATGTS